MAEQQEQIVLDIKINTEEVAANLAEATKALAEHKQQQKELKKAIEESNGTNAVAAKMYADVSAQIEKESREIKSNTALLQAEAMANVQTTDSLDAQRQALNAAQKAYANLSGEAKKAADAEGGLRDQIKKLSDQIKEQESAIGDNRRNVGNYTESMVAAADRAHDLADAFKVSAVASTGMGKATDSLDKAMKLASKNPWMAALSLLLPLLKALFDALKGNEQAMAKVREIMQALGQVFKQFEPLITKVAGVLMNVLGKAFDFITGAITKFLQGIDWLASKLGFDLNLSGVFENAVDAAKNMATEVEAADKRIVDSANKRNEELKKQLADLTKTQADAMKWLNGQMAESTKEYVDEMNARYEKMKAANDKLLEGLTEDEEFEEGEEPKSVEQLAREKFGLDEEVVKYFKQCMADGLSFAEAGSKAFQKQWAKNANGVLAAVNNIGDGFSAMGDLLGNFAEQSEDAAAAQKAFSLIGIITNQASSISAGALAIAEGVASAAELPFPANIPAIITITAQIGALIAGVSSSIAQAKQVFAQANAQKFAGGGIVGGTSYTGDQVHVMTNSREMILNTDQQTRLFDALNGDGKSLGVNYELMAAAMASTPAPVVVYKELQDFGDKVATFDEIASI